MRAPGYPSPVRLTVAFAFPVALLPMAGVLLDLPGGGATPDPASVSAPWGSTGHEMAARTAVAALPPEMPAFFLDAGPELVYLNPEPDRWRVREAVEMNEAHRYDHYIDIENVPEGALDAPNRFTYLRLLYEAGLERPERDAGLLPFRIVELYQRIESGWRRWRSEDDPTRRRWIETGIVRDAGVLGHYVTDASNPHHTTIHFDGWDRDAPNPEGYSTERGFHARFEWRFVDAHVTDEDVLEHMGGAPVEALGTPLREAVLAHIMEAHALVGTLYALDRDFGFDPESPAHPEAVKFAAERIASGARMLTVLWWSAWMGSEPSPAP